MSSYEEAIERFLNESRDLGIEIHNDYVQAKKIFEAIEKNVNFESIITQTKSEELIKECNAFGSVILDWIERYPRLLNDYRKILKIIIDDLKEIKGISVTQFGHDIILKLDTKEFLYYFNDNIQINLSNIIISEKDKEKIALEENKIIQELAEIISLDLYILSWLEHIELLNNTYNIKAVAHTIRNINIIIPQDLVKDLNVVASWWIELRKHLDKLKEVTKTAVQMDEKVTKELMKIFEEENRKNIRDTKLRAAKAGAGLLFNIALSFIPGSTAISASIEAYKKRKIYGDAIKCLK
jgi:hypothetical protein